MSLLLSDGDALVIHHLEVERLIEGKEEMLGELI